MIDTSERNENGKSFERVGDLLSQTQPAVGPPGRGTGQGSAGAEAVQRAHGTAGAADPVDPNRLLAMVWAETVGPEVAENARPVQLREGRLVVTTSSSAWAQTLQLMCELIVARLNDRLGEGAVRKAVFRHAGWEEFPAQVEAAGGSTGHSRGRGRRGASLSEPSGASAPAEPAAVPEDAGQGLSPDETKALADLDELPLDAALKAVLREAMLAGFVRARQDSGRS